MYTIIFLLLSKAKKQGRIQSKSNNEQLSAKGLVHGPSCGFWSALGFKFRFLGTKGY